MKKIWCGAVILLFGMLLIGEAQAQFGAEPLQLSYLENHYFSRVVSDGQGGVYYVTRTGNAGVEMRVHRVDPYGETVFNVIHGPANINKFSTDANADGVVCAVATGDDTQGLLFWIGPDGMQREETNITGFTSAIVNDPRVVAMPDEYGLPTAVVLYEDLEDDMVYVQKKNGVMDMWGQYGFGLGSASEVADYAMIGDGSGGVIIAWTTTVDTALRMQRIDAAGTAVWTAGGIVVIDEGYHADIKGLITNGAGGAFVAAQLNTPTDPYTYMQLILQNGTMWYTGSQLVKNEQNETIFDEVTMAPDGSGGFWMAMFTYSTGAASVQHLSGNYLTWANKTTIPGLTDLYGTGSVVGGLALLPESTGGVYLAWQDIRSASYGLYMTLLDDAAEAVWPVEGLLLSDENGGYLKGLQLSLGADGGCFAMYNDQYDSDWFLQSVDPVGYFGATPFTLDGVHDVPGDQGGQLIVAWRPSYLENVAPADLERYTVWRLLEFAAGKALPRDVITDPAAAAADPAAGAVVWAEQITDKTIYWELVATAEPLQRPAYAAVVASLSDSTAVYAADEHFRVLAHHVNGTTTWASNEMVGHSVDNLAPAMPAALAADMDWNAGAAILTWQPNTESDLLEYRVFRGVGEDFVADASSLMATVTEPGFSDPAADGNASYKVAAVDVHGNVSAFALLAPSGMSGVDLPLPTVSGLTAVAPNPFNPSTSVSFRLATAGHATIQVYDMSGRLVRTLASGEYAQGEHSVTWDGRRDDGTGAASGMYFMRLQADGRVDGRKAMLLK